MTSSPVKLTMNKARKMCLVAQIAVSLWRSDPLFFNLQVIRRYPTLLRKYLLRALDSPLIPAGRKKTLWRAWIADLPDAGHQYLAQHRQSLVKLTRSEVSFALAFQAEDCLPAGWQEKFPRAHLRYLWEIGDLEKLAELCERPLDRGARALAKKLTQQIRALQISAPEPLADFNRPSKAPSQVSYGQIRVLHFLTNSLPHTKSGYTHRSHELNLAWQQAGIEPFVYTRLNYPLVIGSLFATGVDQVDSITYRRLFAKKFDADLTKQLQRTQAQLKIAAKHHRVQLLHTTSNFQNAQVIAPLARELNVPWTYEMRGFLELTWLSAMSIVRQEKAAHSTRFELLRAQELNYMNDAAHVFTLSETMKADLIRRGIPGEKISVTPNSVSPRLLEQNLTVRQARGALGLPQDGFWVGSISSLVDYEGFEILLRAVAHLKANGLKVNCLLAGQGVSAGRLKALSSELGIENQVFFPGALPKKQAEVAFQALNIFVVPRNQTPVTSLVTPLKPIEAMALARPIIVSELAPLTELTQASNAGLTFSAQDWQRLGDRIQELYDDETMCRELAENGRRYASERSWANASKTYREVFEALLNGREPK